MKLLEQILYNASGLSLEEIFDTNYKIACNFLTYVETLDKEQINKYNLLRKDNPNRFDHFDLLARLYLQVTGKSCYETVLYEVNYNYGFDCDRTTLCRGSLLEIILLDKLLEQKIELFYLPLFEQL